MYDISSSHPLPPNAGTNRRGKYRPSCRQETLVRLGPKQSFLLDGTMSSASSLLWWGKARFPDRDYVARTVEEKGKVGVRIWRVK